MLGCFLTIPAHDMLLKTHGYGVATSDVYCALQEISTGLKTEGQRFGFDDLSNSAVIRRWSRRCETVLWAGASLASFDLAEIDGWLK